MEVLITRDYRAMSITACQCLLRSWKEAVETRGQFVLGLATGRTPIGLYEHLTRAHRDGSLLPGAWCERTKTFNLDEYHPIAPTHEGSYHHFMWARLLGHLPIPRENIHLLDGLTEDPKAECARFEREIDEAGGIGCQILGIGSNGHVGFAEPGRPAARREGRTQRVALDYQTCQDNLDKFGYAGEHALSMGIGKILEASEILLLANGTAKALAVAATVLGPCTAWIPASWLQEHENCTLIVDAEAAALLCELTGGPLPPPTSREVVSEAGHKHVLRVLNET